MLNAIEQLMKEQNSRRAKKAARTRRSLKIFRILYNAEMHCKFRIGDAEAAQILFDLRKVAGAVNPEFFGQSIGAASAYQGK